MYYSSRYLDKPYHIYIYNAAWRDLFYFFSAHSMHIWSEMKKKGKMKQKLVKKEQEIQQKKKCKLVYKNGKILRGYILISQDLCFNHFFWWREKSENMGKCYEFSKIALLFSEETKRERIFEIIEYES